MSEQRIPYFDLLRSHEDLRSDFHAVLDELIDTGQFVMGDHVSKFEEEFSRYVGNRFAVSTNSGTSALHLALEACGIGDGDEVITTPLTFIATSAAISYVGAKPVFVDVDPLTWNIDPNKIVAAISTRTKAIVPVHLHGLMADMPAIMKIANEFRLKVIEDAAQAHGASINGILASGFGDAAAFSFYPGKNLGALGEGGAIVSSDTSIIDRARLMRNWGSIQKYQHDEIAFNYRMDSLQAGFLSIKLREIEQWTVKRTQIAKRYSEAFRAEGIPCPHEQEDYKHVYHVYSILSKDRKKISESFDKAGIGHGIHYPVIVPNQRAYQYLQLKKNQFPIAEELSSRFISLPIFPGMTDDEVEAVVSVVLDVES
jgi:dTDP-4-amino-4,6-dideoxygalactose transaminase